MVLNLVLSCFCTFSEMASGTEENKQVSTCIEQSPSLPLPTCEGHASTENNDPIPTNGVSRFDLTYHLSVIKLAPSTGIFRRLSVIDKLLTPAIFVAMVVGIVIGEFVPSVQEAFDTVQFKSVSLREHRVPTQVFKPHIILLSHCNRSHCHDVPRPHEGQVRIAPSTPSEWAIR